MHMRALPQIGSAREPSSEISSFNADDYEKDLHVSLPLWSRDGHLLELALSVLQAGELSAEDRQRAEGHLGECALCRARQEELRALAARPLPTLRRPPAPAAPAPMAEVIPLRRWLGPAVALAAAAVGLVVLLPSEPGPDTFTARGGALQLEVYRDEGARSTRLHAGDVVHGGDRLGFRVGHPKGGELIVFGLDSAGSVYPVWPSSPAPATQQVQPRQGVQSLDAAIVLDNSSGQERLIALLCKEPRSWEEIVRAAGRSKPPPEGALATLEPACAQAEVLLRKDVSSAP